MQNEHINQSSESIAELSNKVKWLRIPQVISIYSLSRTKIYQLANDKKIVSVSLREPGQTKGTKLFLKSSIDTYIDSFLPTPSN